jgi:hypothetical protein
MLQSLLIFLNKCCLFAFNKLSTASHTTEHPLLIACLPKLKIYRLFVHILPFVQVIDSSQLVWLIWSKYYTISPMLTFASVVTVNPAILIISYTMKYSFYLLLWNNILGNYTKWVIFWYLVLCYCTSIWTNNLRMIGLIRIHNANYLYAMV